MRMTRDSCALRLAIFTTLRSFTGSLSDQFGVFMIEGMQTPAVGPNSGWGPITADIETLLATPPENVRGVLSRLDGLHRLFASLPQGENGAATSFTYLYRAITARVLESLDEFEDSDFLERLDVEFGKLYFEAVLAWGRRDPAVPDAWAKVFKRQQ